MATNLLNVVRRMRVLLGVALALLLGTSSIPALAQETITLTTTKAVGETIKLRLKKTGTDTPVLTGLSGSYTDDKETDYIIRDQTITITGATSRLYCRNAGITSVTFSATSSLAVVYLENNAITSINLDALSKLSTLVLDHNPLTALSVTNKPSLTRLSAASTGLTNSTLQLSELPLLRQLDLSNNNFTSLDVSAFSVLQKFFCQNNQLTALTLPANPSKLSEMRCYANQLGTAALNALLMALPEPAPMMASYFIVDTTNASEGNAASKEAVTTATNRGYYIWDYAGGTNPFGKKYEGVEAPAPTFAVTSAETRNGSFVIEGASDLTAVPQGTQLTVKATPNEGYLTSEILINGTNVIAGAEAGSVNEHTFTVQGATEVKVVFAIKRYPVTKEVSAGGSIRLIPPIIETTGLGAHGIYVNIIVTPQPGYVLESLTANGEDIMTLKEFKLMGPTVVKAVFVQPGARQFAVTSAETRNGSFVIEGASDLTAVPQGTQLTVKATPNEGYLTSEILINGTNVIAGAEAGSVNEHTFTVQGATEVKVVFAIKRYPVTKDVSAGGSIRLIPPIIETTGLGAHGIYVNIIVTPQPGYVLESLTANGEDIMTLREFKLMGPTVVKAVFVQPGALQSVEETSIRVLPNPATDHLFISGAEGEVAVRLYDLSGNVLRSDVTDAAGNLRIELAGLPSGSYLVRIGDTLAKIQVR